MLPAPEFRLGLGRFRRRRGFCDRVSHDFVLVTTAPNFDPDVVTAASRDDGEVVGTAGRQAMLDRTELRQ